jgi:hypothetical protein
MNEYLIDCRMERIEKNQIFIREQLSQLKSLIKPENDLWDNADIKRNWKVSDRTLANWRAKDMIKYIKVKGKIWYPREAREGFLMRYYVDK